MLILALAHAEVGGMYPVAGGSARYPHFAFGSLAGFAIGWIVWVGSVTVAPIDVLAVTTYLVQWFPWMMVSQGGTEVLTALGIVFSVVLFLPRLDWRGGSWLWPYFIGLGILSYLSPTDFGGTGLLPFGVDIVIVAAFSIAIYYYAMSVRLTPEEVRSHVADARAEAEEEEGITL